MAKKGFDITALLGQQVSNLDTNAAEHREQIEYIDIGLIDEDPNNFYELSQLDELAANIELFGLQQPLRVRASADIPGRFVIVSGHRRRAAIHKLVEDGREDMREIACIRERAEGSAALQELRLIFANSDTRRMTSADISKQVERVEILLYQLKEEGYDFPGRMRDHVAEACKVSKSKLARLKVIRDDLDPIWKPSYETGELSESVAYRLARMPVEHQRAIFDEREQRKASIRWFHESSADRLGSKLEGIDNLTCEKLHGNACNNRTGKYKQALQESEYSLGSCAKCCDKCADLSKCKHACPMLADKIKKLRADTKEQRRQEHLATEERERPAINKIMKYWSRFGEARNSAEKSVKEAFEALGRWYSDKNETETIELECLKTKVTTSTRLPYGYSYGLEEVEKFVRIADLFGCSLDYLLCRTDAPQGFVPSGLIADPPAEGWIPLQWIPGLDTPHEPRWAVGKFKVEGMADLLRKMVYWDGMNWLFHRGGERLSAECIAWFPIPEDDA